MGLLAILTIIFVVAKILGIIAWSWWLVFTPLFIDAGIVLIFIAVWAWIQFKTWKELKDQGISTMENTEEIKSLLTSGSEVTFYSLKYPDDSAKRYASKDLGLLDFTDSQWDYFAEFQEAINKLESKR